MVVSTLLTHSAYCSIRSQHTEQRRGTGTPMTDGSSCFRTAMSLSTFGFPHSFVIGHWTLVILSAKPEHNCRKAASSSGPSPGRSVDQLLRNLMRFWHQTERPTGARDPRPSGSSHLAGGPAALRAAANRSRKPSRQHQERLSPSGSCDAYNDPPGRIESQSPSTKPRQ